MKNHIVLLGLMFIGKIGFAQQQTSTKKVKDTIIKTEVVNVVTSYAPKVTDAFKIKQKPVIKLSKEANKKTLEYNFISVPVASTFIPKSGTLKGVKIEKKERLFNNYIAVGFGNNTTPYFNAYMHKNTEFDSEYGIGANFISSTNPIKNITLSSSFYNIGIDAFYKQEDRYFNWKVGFNTERNKYNWYGLPININFAEPTITSIKEEQTYKLYKITAGAEIPDDSYITNVNASASYFSDAFNSNEFSADINANFSFPFGRFGVNLEDLNLDTFISFLGSNFENNYEKTSSIKYSFLTAGINPSYQFYIADFNIKIGAKGVFSMDIKNNKNQFYVYPDVKITHPIVKKIATIYAGASGNLHNNSFEKYANKNPYVSPTLQLLQTHEAYTFFGGIKGIVADHINYNIKGSYKNEQNKPLFALNKSKSDGIATSINGHSYKGYEYGNSFNILYDTIKTISVFGELTYDASKNITLGLNGRFNKYAKENQPYVWNLPKIKTEVFGTYKRNKWYASANLFFVGERKGILYTNVGITATTLKSYFDVNVNGGYHINSLLTVFAKINNASNSNYQRFTNFNSQGIQAIGGIIWKFDSLF